MMMMSSTPEIAPKRGLDLVQGRVNRLWTRGTLGHHLIIAMSGSGKTAHIVRNILPLCARERMVFVDVKNDTDPMLSGVGRPIGPRNLALVLGGHGGGPFGTWFRLVIDPVNRPAEARAAIRQLLQWALSVGDMVICVDEARTITELGLGELYESVLTRGRSNGVSVVSAVAATDNMRPAVRTQWAYAWAGTVNGAEVIRSTLGMLNLPNTQKVGSTQNPYWLLIRDLAPFEWLYLDHKGPAGNKTVMARVKSWNPDAI